VELQQYADGGVQCRGHAADVHGQRLRVVSTGRGERANITEDSVVGTGGRYKDYAWWVQDNFRVTPRLTLNLGLRHDILSPYKEVLNRESFFNPDGPNAAAAAARHSAVLWRRAE